MDEWEAVNKGLLKHLETKPASETIKMIIFIDAWDQLKSDENLRSQVKLVQVHLDYESNERTLLSLDSCRSTSDASQFT